MNFPENQRTGVLAEIDVERLFASWSWTVGRDRLDTGYDLFVEPDRMRFKGQRFLVQVKGTARRKRGAPTARVSKPNLRRYAINPLPVFLIRAGVDGVLHWLHVQSWAEANLKRLDGSGETGVPMPRAQRLDDKDGFLAYLDKVLKPVAECSGGLAGVARDRARYLSSLDSRLMVRVGIEKDVETYEIFASSEPASLGIEMLPAPDPANVSKLKDAVHYGLPATIQVDSFRMTGSELFTAIGADSFHRGSVSVGSASAHDGTVSLYPGTCYSLLASDLVLPARLYNGQGGFAISNAEVECLFNLELRGDVTGPSLGNLQVTMGLRGERIAAAPIREHTSLASLGEWAEQVLENQAILMELAFRQKRFHLQAYQASISSIWDVLYYAFILGRLHKVAKALYSNLTVDNEFVLSEEDVSDIHLLYFILRGERKAVDLSSVEFVAPSAISIAPGKGLFYIETTLSVSFCGQLLGAVPIAIDLNDFTLEEMSEPLRYCLSKRADSSAFMYYSEHGRADAAVSRT